MKKRTKMQSAKRKALRSRQSSESGGRIRQGTVRMKESVRDTGKKLLGGAGGVRKKTRGYARKGKLPVPIQNVSGLSARSRKLERDNVPV